MPLLHHLDQATGLPVRRPKPVRYEKRTPGELIHVDIKKRGLIPGGGWRVHGRNSAQTRRVGAAQDRAARRGVSPSRGYTFLHHVVDDCTRLTYSERLPDERKETAAAYWIRAHAFFAEQGIAVTAVMTENGSCYRSHAFAEALGNDITHRRTRPFRPQTNGKVERFNRTLATEWAYAHTPQKPNAKPPTNTGSITTITTDPTPGSEDQPPPNAFTTSQGRASSRR